jgi:hypothetical protein
MFSIIRVDSRNAESLETLGAKPKFWFDDRSRLFKAEARGTGEDWAEKIACELCGLLGLPHVHYDLAHDVHLDIPGVICPTCAPRPLVMGLGNQMLQALDPDYPEGMKYKVRQHTVDAVTDVLRLLVPLPEAFGGVQLPFGIDSALGVFVGYVMLDAWIANQDRHHQNWAVLRSPGRMSSANNLHLAPTFDHGASLARNLTDGERSERLRSRDENRQLAAFVRRARSAFYADPQQTKALTTVEAWHAFSQKSHAAATIWLEMLRKIDTGMVQQIIDTIPLQRMSQISRDFTLALLTENRNRLLAGEC